MFYKEDWVRNDTSISRFNIWVYRLGNWSYYSCQNKLLKRILLFIYHRFYFISSGIFHCQITAKTKIGMGLRLDHNGSGIVIHPDAIIGTHARIFHQVTIGINSFAPKERYGAATIGNNVYIGVGAKVIGKIKIGSNVVIGAGAVVIRDVPDNSMAVGVPAQIKKLNPEAIKKIAN